MTTTGMLVYERDGQSYTCEISSRGELTIESCATRGPVLEIPDEIDGYPVSELGQEAFAGLSGVRSIVCPPHVRGIGRAAFRNCAQLERIVLPFEVPEFREMWFEGCTALREIEAPGCAGTISLNSVRGIHVGRVNVGASVRDVRIPRVPDAYLDSIAVDEGNPWISTDGTCLYDASGAVLLKCLCTVRRYEVARGCRVIGPEAFAYNKTIEEVVLPEGVTTVSGGAFESSTVRLVEVPGSLREIENAAFSNCRGLERIALDEGLRRIERHAFRGCTSLRELRVPASVSHLDAHAFEGSAAAGNGGITVDGGNPVYSIDGAGVLYERGEAGQTLLAAMSEVEGEYTARPDTCKIAERAFSNSTGLRAVVLPEGLVSIGKSAFSGCKSLVRADLPKTLESIGESAFLHTSLEELVLPAPLAHIGRAALCTDFERQDLAASAVIARGVGRYRLVRSRASSTAAKARHRGAPCRMSVDESNERYCRVSDFICERPEEGNGKLRALWYAGDGADVVVPAQIGTLEPYAVANAPAVRNLWLHEGLATEGRHAVQVFHPLESIHVVSLAGADNCILHPAPNAIGLWAQNHAFEFDDLDLRLLAQDCDVMLYRQPASFERSWRLLDRLAHPVLLDGALKQLIAAEFRERLDATVADFARRDYLVGARQLVDTGIVGAGNVAHAVEVANAANGTAVTAYLLETRRALGANCFEDFSDFEL